MSRIQLAYYFKQQCKFRLKNGKEVYGVIWEDSFGNEKQYFFASASDHQLYEDAAMNNNIELMDQIKQPVDLSQIIYAERIAC